MDNNVETQGEIQAGTPSGQGDPGAAAPPQAAAVWLEVETVPPEGDPTSIERPVFFVADQVRFTLESTPEFGPVGDYAITVLVNGVPRITLPPSGSEEFATTIVLDDLAFALPDKFLTLRADSAVADRAAPRPEKTYCAGSSAPSLISATSRR